MSGSLEASSVKRAPYIFLRRMSYERGGFRDLEHTLINFLQMEHHERSKIDRLMSKQLLSKESREEYFKFKKYLTEEHILKLRETLL